MGFDIALGIDVQVTIIPLGACGSIESPICIF